MPYYYSKKPILQWSDSDDDEYGDVFENFTHDLFELCKRKFPTGYVKAAAKFVGWNNRSGDIYLAFDERADEKEWSKQGANILGQLAPNSDYSLTVRNYGSGLLIIIKHHDNPVNGDHFHLRPCSEKFYQKFNIGY